MGSQKFPLPTCPVIVAFVVSVKFVISVFVGSVLLKKLGCCPIPEPDITGTILVADEVCPTSVAY